MIHSVLSVCTANICRSPIGEFALKGLRPALTVNSAGVNALVGHAMDPQSETAARHMGLAVTPHSAQQLDTQLGAAHDLILVMTARHRNSVTRHWPELSGKTFLLRQFLDGKDIPDPYRQGISLHYRAAEMIIESMQAWAKQIDTING